MRADAAALESILMRSGLDTGAESAAAASCAAAVAAAHQHMPDAAQRARFRAALDAPRRQQCRVEKATCSMTVAAAAHTAAAPAARVDMHVMRQPRSACLKHRVATVGLLRLHHLPSSVTTEHADGL